MSGQPNTLNGGHRAGKHCENLGADRAVGQRWEKIFCDMLVKSGYAVTPHQHRREGAAVMFIYREGRHAALPIPDVTVWSKPPQHHEIRHKEPTKSGRFGLEVYRFDALVELTDRSGEAIFYTIHNHALTPDGRDGLANCLEHWVTCSVAKLYRHLGAATTLERSSWCDGVAQQLPVHFWPTRLWRPLADMLRHRDKQWLA